jgi:hypothetical protein
MYRTPLLVLRRGDDYLVGLWYGSDAHWVKNVLAAGACELRIRGRDVRLVKPELLVDPARRLLPLPLRLIGRLVNLTEFLRMSPDHYGQTSALAPDPDGAIGSDYGAN